MRKSSTGRGRRRRGLRTVAGAACLAVSACGHAAPAGGTGAAGEASASAAAGAGGVGNLGTGPTGQSTQGTASAGAGGSAAQIVSFRATQQPLCPIKGTSDAPFSQQARPVTLTWKVTGARGIALSIDMPDFYKTNHTGSYGSYGSTGTLSVNFSCDDTKQRTSHTYTLNTLSDPSKARSITVSAQSA
jgi:hypothetical protein